MPAIILYLVYSKHCILYKIFRLNASKLHLTYHMMHTKQDEQQEESMVQNAL